MAKANAVVVPEKKQLPAEVMVDFAADAGMGLEGADKASFAIPFLAVLQANSPQLEVLREARAGMFLNTVTNELYETVEVIPVAFQRRYLAWAPRAAGGGFKGEFSVAQVEGQANELGWKKDPTTGQMVLPDGSILKDTRNHFILVVGKDGNTQQAMFSLASTQIKKSKTWLTLIQTIKMKDSAGRSFTPPSFSHVYRCSTVNEENDKGKWKGVGIALVGPVTDPGVYAAAKHFHSLVVAGKVEVAAPAHEVGEAF